MNLVVNPSHTSFSDPKVPRKNDLSFLIVCGLKENQLKTYDFVKRFFWSEGLRPLSDAVSIDGKPLFRTIQIKSKYAYFSIENIF